MILNLICDIMNCTCGALKGDYNNDISMFNAAKVGIAVFNGCPEALAAADFVTVSNEENAVAKVIYDLENGKYI